MPISFTLLIQHGANQLHLVLTLPRHRPPHPPGLTIGMLNIRYGRAFGIVQAVRAVELGRFDLMVLTGTNISTSVYCWNWLGCDIVYSLSWPAIARGVQVGVGLVSWDRPMGWSLESTRFHGSNMVSCNIIPGTSRTPIVGGYLPPSILFHLPNL